MNLVDDRVVDFPLQSRLHQKIPQDFVNHSCPVLQGGLEPCFSHSYPRKKEKSQQAQIHTGCHYFMEISHIFHNYIKILIIKTLSKLKSDTLSE